MAKVVIVGGGIVGATTAFELTKRNFDVTIVDNFEQRRATSAAAGIICPWVSQRRNQTWYELANKGASFLAHLVEELKDLGKQNTGYKQVGALRLHTNKARLEKIQDITLKRRETAPQIGEIKLLSKAETKEKFPFLADDFYALYVSGAARVDG